MSDEAVLSVRVPRAVRSRLKAIAADRGESLQTLLGGLVQRFLTEAGQRPPELSDVQHRLRGIEGALRAEGVRALWVFGSVARGDAGPASDVDLAVEFDPGRGESLFALVHLKAEIEQALGRAVDIGERSAMRPRIAAAADREMVRVF